MPVLEGVSVGNFDIQVFNNANISLFKVHHRYRSRFNLIPQTIRWNNKLLLLDMPLLPSENETKHYHYPHLMFTSYSGNACTWSSSSFQKNIANPSEDSGIDWYLDRSKFDQVLRKFVQEQKRGSSELEKKVVTLRTADFRLKKELSKGGVGPSLPKKMLILTGEKHKRNCISRIQSVVNASGRNTSLTG
ncbi:hypothetical protein K435DRAFT_835756 [Dendrothele bispora CBS 962.96]|uniref:Uncharacterized protein n=1 Tax=Dendrothele bispora (strain CBS 962.96) TaxID=1314807 RepID=A0A4S8MLH0_DENBC|nr:hypothetical protein K435DRAFT_835756 [Dendrothele bispora CBS 962.96]